jgi:superfamily I DNA and/or RNA helicase
LVNYLEACAVVAALEKLAADPAELWADRPGANGTRPIVAVIALYAAQAALVRCLADRSTALRNRAFDLEIGLPEAFREREFGRVFVSLTRSHVHRAVTYGDGPNAVALALTRARRKLILFGDPATLGRRRQWKGRLEQLSESEADSERSWVERLVRYLEGTGRHGRLFQFREGSLT